MVNAVLLSRRVTRGFGEFGQTQLQTSSLPPLNNLSCLSKLTCRKKYQDIGKSAALWLCSWNINLLCISHRMHISRTSSTGHWTQH